MGHQQSAEGYYICKYLNIRTYLKFVRDYAVILPKIFTLFTPSRMRNSSQQLVSSLVIKLSMRKVYNKIPTKKTVYNN